VGAGRGGGTEPLTRIPWLEYLLEEVVLREDSPEVLLEKGGDVFAFA